MKCIGAVSCPNSPTHLTVVLDEEVQPATFAVWPLCPEHTAEQFQNDIAEDGVAVTILAIVKIEGAI